MKGEDLIELIDAVLDGECSEADFLKLEAELHVDPEARKLYYDRLQLHTLLEVEKDEVERRSQPTKKVVRYSFIQDKRRLFVTAAAAALFAFLVPSLFNRDRGRDDSNPIASTEPVAAGFGVLAGQDKAEWDRQNFNTGDLIPGGRIGLKGGVAQLELFSGVTIILQDAEFELHSDMEMTVHSGKIRAIVPKPARGFRVNTPTGEVVDLGTEFALSVDDGHADLHVLKGEVEWHPVSETVRTLVDGDSLRWTGKGAEESTVAFDQFVGLAEIEKRRDLKYQNWLENSGIVAADPRILAYYPMTQLGKRQLDDAASSELDGTIVRSKPAFDRWGNANRALDFSSTGSRVRVNLPGEHSALTLYCWVRIDSLDKWYNSLFLTDGHELHEPHWQIMNDGRLFFSVKARNHSKGKPDKKVVFSPSFWTPQLSGQWLQIAAVYDSSVATITHYLNGEVFHSEVLPEEYIAEKVKIGAASIGNWSDPTRTDSEFAVRNLNGAIDEFAIFGAALSAEEIQELYQKGRP